jgi:hypothetical protein
MLSAEMIRIRRSPGSIPLALAIGLVLGVLAGALFDRHETAAHPGAGEERQPVGNSVALGESTRSRDANTPASAPSGGREAALAPVRDALRSALQSGLRAAQALGGEAAAAVWVGGDPRPVLSGPVLVPHRLWSMSKAVAAVAALRTVGDRPEPVLASAIARAIRRSDNCAIRRVIVGLQDRVGRGTAGTLAAFERVLAQAGARIERPPQLAPAEPACLSYLQEHQGGLAGGDLGVVPQFGTAKWSDYDAVSFAHALSVGVYGGEGAYLTSLMAASKQPPLEQPSPPDAPPLDWGAGAVFPASWRPAWKAGWGGSQDRPAHFLAGQVVVLRLGSRPVALAAVFVPSAEPPSDNPGLTAAPRALELIFEAARRGLEYERVGGAR